jgi:hypothetical protein
MSTPSLSLTTDYVITQQTTGSVLECQESYVDQCNVKNTCEVPCVIDKQQVCNNPCLDPCAHTKSVGSSWEWFGLFVLWFIALTVLFWLIFYSLKPPFVLQSDGNQVDTAKVLLAAVICAFVLIVIIWLIKAAMGK